MTTSIKARSLDELGDSLQFAVNKACAEIDRLRELNRELAETLAMARTRLKQWNREEDETVIKICDAAIQKVRGGQ